MMKTTTLAVLFAAVLGSVATTTAQAYGYEERGISADNYGSSRALRVGDAIEADVIQVRNILIAPQTSMARQGTGAAIGGTLGGLAGSGMGQGHGNTAATVLGGLLGGLAGGALATRADVEAQEIVLRRVGGDRLVVVVQAGRELAAGSRRPRACDNHRRRSKDCETSKIISLTQSIWRISCE